jgi:hypothetical protein
VEGGRLRPVDVDLQHGAMYSSTIIKVEEARRDDCA